MAPVDMVVLPEAPTDTVAQEVLHLVLVGAEWDGIHLEVRHRIPLNAQGENTRPLSAVAGTAVPMTTADLVAVAVRFAAAVAVADTPVVAVVKATVGVPAAAVGAHLMLAPTKVLRVASVWETVPLKLTSTDH